MSHYIEHPLRGHLLRKSLRPGIFTKLLASLCLLLSCLSSNAAGIDATINAAMTPITEAVAGFIFLSECIWQSTTLDYSLVNRCGSFFHLIL